MSTNDPKPVGEGLEQFWIEFAERHNRPDVLEAFYEGASIWTDNPHPRAWLSKHGSVKPGKFSADRIAREKLIHDDLEREKR